MENEELLSFKHWPKIPRISNDSFIITEKMDGTNGQIAVLEDGTVMAGSRNKWLSAEEDNQGFYKWIQARKQQILDNLPVGRYYGEFVGAGIQRTYNLKEKRFYFFDTRLNFVEGDFYTVPILAETGGGFPEFTVWNCEMILRDTGSHAVSGFMEPEGFVIRSKLTGQMWKHIIEN